MSDTKIPSELLSSLRNLKGFDESAFINVHGQVEVYPSVRFNPQKMEWRASPDAKIGEWFRDMEKIPWCEWGRWLDHRPSFILDPCWHAGAYYVQEASSMFLHHALKQVYPSPEKNMKVLDLCAAPGGKSSLLASFFADQLLISNEVIQSRSAILAENITRWGSPNVVVTQNDAREFKALPGYFDLIVVDAPCSGSGLFRKDATAIEEWSPGNVALCSQRQQRILNDILPSLAENGVLIYSTCSYSPEEDEEIVDWMLREQNMECIALAHDESWNIVESGTKAGGIGYRFYPDKVKGEGLFLSCLQKKIAEESSRPRKKSTEKLSRQQTESLRNWISNIESFAFTEKSGNVIAMPVALEENIREISSVLRVKKSGTLLGKFAGQELIPDHELAMSQMIRNDIPKIDLNLEDSLAYLRRETLSLDQPKKGWMLVAYDGLKLGWVKVLDRRINNYYPPSWRILKG